MSDLKKVIGWQRGEAPRDGHLYVCVGSIIESDDEGGGSYPFIAKIKWLDEGKDPCWVNESGLSLAEWWADEVRIDFWCNVPGEEAWA